MTIKELKKFGIELVKIVPGEYEVYKNEVLKGVLVKLHFPGSGRGFSGVVGAIPSHDYWEFEPLNGGRSDTFDTLKEAKTKLPQLISRI